MIYIIIGQDNKTLNEWVQPETFDSGLEAATRCQELNLIDLNFSYRVDTVEPSTDKTPTRLYADKEVAKERAALKLKMNEAYGKPADWVSPLEKFKTSDYNEMLISQAGGDGDTEYKDTDSIRVDEETTAVDAPVWASSYLFKLTELFPPLSDGFTSDYCQECGVRVEGRYQRTHVTWHNKLLP